MRVPSIVIWPLYFFWLLGLIAAAAYGATRVPGSSVMVSYLLMVAMVCFLIATRSRTKNAKLAIVVMGLGLLCRSALEVRASFLKEALEGGEMTVDDWELLVAVYLITFVLPALLLCDWLSDRRLRRRAESEEKVVEDEPVSGD